MAVTGEYSELYLEERNLGQHNLESNTLTAILMDVTFTWDAATMLTYADISAHEIATAGGYTQKAANLTTVAVANVASEIITTADDLAWTASDANFETTMGCCIINNTHATETVICYIDFGANMAVPSGTILRIPFSGGFLKDVGV